HCSTSLRLNRSSYFVMKNTPEVGLLSNFWGAVHAGAFFFGGLCQGRIEFDTGESHKDASRIENAQRIDRAQPG
ncbi:hypothetical protein, partial [Pigmentiphaga humi]|uniref:hypothetical protein n=1 Tax=Pigmentiphaga humi TaxID=2478468 RepID=UPI001CA41509